MRTARRAFRLVLLSGAVAPFVLCASLRSVAQEAPGPDAAPTAPATVSTAPSSTAAGAEEPGRKPDRPWKGEAEAGIINATGNSRSESVRARIKLQYEPGQWRHALTGDFIRVAEQGITTTEQYNAAWKSDRALSRRSFVYGAARYETDRIAGYSPRVAESAGYGRKFPFSDRLRLEAEAGAGGRHTWATDGTRKSEAIVRIASRFFWGFGAQSEFSEEAFSEFGDENVHSESQTSLKTRINADFSMKANVTVKHDTVVAADRHKTDTITSLTLVYDL
jgi:putative salt-induced outer membrane protein